MVMILMNMVSPSSEAAVVVFPEAAKNGDGPRTRTPRDTLFDPFAPGSDLLLNAPRPKAHWENSDGKIFRRLGYGLGKKFEFNLDEAEGDGEGEAEPESENERLLVRNLYGDRLEVIAYVQAEEVLASFPEELDDGSDASSPSSNPSLPVFSGIAETCPPAPMRKMGDVLKPSVAFDSSLCKKLEF